MITAYIDKIDCTICGWAYNSENSAPLEISCFIDKKLVVSVLADQYRIDVMEAGYGQGYNGFSIDIPETLFDSKFHTINLIINNHPEFSFQNMPFRQLFGDIIVTICPIVEGENNNFFNFWQRHCEELGIENSLTEKKIQTFISKITRQINSHVELAYVDNEIVGYCFLEGKQDKNYLHSAVLRMSILSDFRQQGIGKKLAHAALEYAQKSLARVELTVAVSNQSAIHLYKQLGFKQEGILRKACITLDGYEDEIIMAYLC